MASLGLLYYDGIWIWDNSIEGLRYDKVVQKTEKGEETSAKKEIDKHVLTFQDNLDNLEVLKFRLKYQRRCKLGEPEVITIQDIKDVAIYTADQSKLTSEFLCFFHIPTVDRFLRALLIYFDYYIKVYDLLTYRRARMNRKLRNNASIQIERHISEELGDFRAMVAREYCNMILGAADCFPYHHLSNKNRTSMTKKDARLTEMLLSVSVRIVWLTMYRKNYSLIEVELHRLFRTEFYNVVVHRQTEIRQPPLPQIEERVLHGKPPPQRKLLRRSPVTQEILGEHDFRLIGCGVVRTDNLSDKIARIQAAYLLPEHELIINGIIIGILGRDRKDFDAMLMELSEEEKEGSLTILLKAGLTRLDSELTISEENVEEEVTVEIASIESTLSYLSGYGKSIVVELAPDSDEEVKKLTVEEQQPESISESFSEESIIEMPPMPVDTSICKLDPPSHLFQMPVSDTMYFDIPPVLPSAVDLGDVNQVGQQQLQVWLKRKRQNVNDK